MPYPSKLISGGLSTGKTPPPEPGVDYRWECLAVGMNQRFRLFGGNYHSTINLLGMGDDLINCLLQVIPFRYVVLDKLDVGHFSFVFINRTRFD